MAPPTDREKNRFSARAKRYANVGTKVGGVAARMAGARLFGIRIDRAANALEMTATLGGLKGPIMKVAQLLATIPDALPPEYATELTKLQSQAPNWASAGRRNSKTSSIIRLPPPRSARCIAPARKAARIWPASCNIRICSRRSRPT
jgi:hypothetical protein